MAVREGQSNLDITPKHDTGSAKRYNQFFLDPDVPSECQQTTAKGYVNGYDRGHLVPANHLDQS
ncbi:MAG: DNA/RNA non-specific endonuclease [Methylosarcina sp.]